MCGSTQAQGAWVATVEQRQRQQGQVVGQHHRLDLQAQLAFVADLGPQARMQRVFALHGVVADQLHAEPVELGDQVRRNVDHLLLQDAGVFLGQRQAGGHFVVDHDVDLREVAEQRWRIGVLQGQLRAGHHLVGPHVEVDRVGRLHATQAHGVVLAQLLEAELVLFAGRIRCRRRRFAGGGLRGGRRCAGRDLIGLGRLQQAAQAQQRAGEQTARTARQVHLLVGMKHDGHCESNEGSRWVGACLRL